MRFLYKLWQDRRPGFTRRVRWYQPGDPAEPIRLKFEDAAHGEASRTYPTAAEAQAAYDAFCQGRLTVALIAEGNWP
jgi:hypothetical protein